MPSKKRNSKSTSKNNQYSFVNVSLSQADKDAVEAWALENEPDFPIVIDDLLYGNYKLSLSWDDYNDCYTASLTCRSETDVNTGLILTGRSSTAFQALAVVLYKHVVYFDSGEWERENRDGGWG